MIKVIIIDDEPLARSIVESYCKSNEQLQVVHQCGDGFEGIKAIQLYQPDLIFLDVQMPKINGFEMLELVDNTPLVIFTTAFEEYAIKAFEAQAVDYLLKPFSKDRFDKAIQKVLLLDKGTSVKNTEAIIDAAANNPIQQNRVVVKDGSKIKIIPINQIQYVEAADDYVKIVTEAGSFLKKKTMAYFEDSMHQFSFVRIHRSYIVNSQLITRIDVHEKDTHIVLLSTGTQLPVSKSGYIKLKAILGI